MPDLTELQRCTCGCCLEAKAMIAHADDHDLRYACTCKGYAEHEQCDCAFCVSMLTAVEVPNDAPLWRN